VTIFAITESVAPQLTQPGARGVAPQLTQPGARADVRFPTLHPCSVPNYPFFINQKILSKRIYYLGCQSKTKAKS